MTSRSVQPRSHDVPAYVTWPASCLACGAGFEARDHAARCGVCGGVSEPVLGPRRRELPIRPAGLDPEEAFAAFLPSGLAERVDRGTSIRTPTVRLPGLEAELGLSSLWLKDETGQPTGSTKDRCAAMVLATFRALGIHRFVVSSTGNTARALARAVARDPAFEAHFVVGRGFPPPSDHGVPERLTSTVVDGTYGDATRAAEALAAGDDWVYEGGFANWARREGAKLAYLEAYLDLPAPPDVVVQAVSSGLGILAADKAARELSATSGQPITPRFVLAQENTCAPMASAYSAGRRELSEDDIVPAPTGLATAILHGDPHASYPYVHDLVRRSKGDVVAVSRSEIRSARDALLAQSGIDACYASSAALAGVISLARAGGLDPRATVLVKIGGRLLREVDHPPTPHRSGTEL